MSSPFAWVKDGTYLSCQVRLWEERRRLLSSLFHPEQTEKQNPALPGCPRINWKEEDSHYLSKYCQTNLRIWSGVVSNQALSTALWSQRRAKGRKLFPLDALELPFRINASSEAPKFWAAFQKIPCSSKPCYHYFLSQLHPHSANGMISLPLSHLFSPVSLSLPRFLIAQRGAKPCWSSTSSSSSSQFFSISLSLDVFRNWLPWYQSDTSLVKIWWALFLYLPASTSLSPTCSQPSTEACRFLLVMLRQQPEAEGRLIFSV